MAAVTVIAFVAAMVNIPFAIAWLRGLKFDTKGLTCPEDIKDVKDTVLSAKVIQIFNAVAALAITILSSI